MAKRHPVRAAHTGTPASTDPEDLLLERTLAASSWASRNRQALTIGAIVLVLLVGGGLYWANYRQSQLEQAAIELERVRQNVALGDSATATVELNQYLQRFGNTPYAGEAELLLGEIHMAMNQPAQAAEALADAADPSDALGVQAMILLAKAHEEQGRIEEAEQVLLRVAEEADLEFQAHEALAEAARLRLTHGNPAGAVELYERLLEELDPAAPQRPIYEMRLGEARARAS